MLSSPWQTVAGGTYPNGLKAIHDIEVKTGTANRVLSFIKLDYNHHNPDLSVRTSTHC